MIEEELALLTIKEDYLKEDIKNLKKEWIRAKEEVKRIQSVPLTIGQFLEMIDENYAIVQSSGGVNYMVRVLSTIDREMLKPSVSVGLHRGSHALVEILPNEVDASI